MLAGVVRPDDLPGRRGRAVRRVIDARSSTRSSRRWSRTTVATGSVGMDDHHAEALTRFRAFNYERIYLRADSQDQAGAVHRLLRALVDWYTADPARLAAEGRHLADDADPVREAVAFVGGMTDRFAHDRAITHLGWSAADLPIGLDSPDR